MSARLVLRKRWWLGLPLLFILFTALAHRYFYEVPVLMYHIIDAVPEEGGGNTVSPASFERQMEFLKVHRYRVITLSELFKEIESGAKIPAKTVAITFDDGTLDNIRNAYPVLKKMGHPATIFMITDNIGEEGWLSEEDLRILDESNIAIGSHTLTHAFLPEHEPARVLEEVTVSKRRLEELLGHPVTLFSYPAGGVTPEVKKMVREAGYEGAVTTNYGKDRRDIYAVNRIKIKESSGNLFSFWLKVSGYYHLGKKRVKYPGKRPEGPVPYAAR